MLSLEMELIAVLLLTAVVGILMGRFLCKSGENEERRKKRKVIHAFETSQHELKISRDRLKEYSFKMTELEDTIAKREQQIRNMETKLLASDKQVVKLLDELKILEKYRPRFESLSNEFNLQSRELDRVKAEKRVYKKEIEDLNISSHRLDKSLVESKKRESELEGSIEKLKQKLKEERISYKNSEESRTEEFESLLQKINQKYIKELNVKNRAYERLEQELNKRYKDTVEQKDRAYEKLEQELNRKYNSIVRQKDEAYDRLEHDKSKEYQNMVESKSESYKKLREEYEEFKLNYNLDSDRLTNIEEENRRIYQTLETIAMERDDLLARLRAVSSVVNAVGVDNNNKQLLLEK